MIHLLVSRGFIPVIMPIGVGADGTAYHINSDLFAGKLARTLQAEKLILMTNVPGVVDRDGKLAFVLTASDAEELLRDGAVPADMQPRLTAALAAVREGVQSVHIIDGGVPSALLLEVLTNSGVGTAVRGRRRSAFPRGQPELFRDRGRRMTWQGPRGETWPRPSTSARRPGSGTCTSARAGSRAPCASPVPGRSSSSTRAT